MPSPILPMAVCFDLETTNLDPMWGVLLCSDSKPWATDHHETYIHTLSKGYDDKVVVEKTIKYLNQFSILVAHNGVFFDRKFLNGRSMYHHLEDGNNNPLLLDPKAKIIDPWRIAKNHLNFRGNSLDRISDYLHTSKTKSIVSGEIWMKAIYNRDQSCLDYIVEHCIIDVDVLEEVAWQFRKFIGNVNSWGSA